MTDRDRADEVSLAKAQLHGLPDSRPHYVSFYVSFKASICSLVVFLTEFITIR